jgi:RNA polymerase sigma-70 factor (ECF subfamily)
MSATAVLEREATSVMDPESQRWLEALHSDGEERERALVELRDLLLRAARFEMGRRRAAHPHLRGGDLDDLAHQAADDAMVALLAKLDDFRGDSRFTTWAYKFALYEAAAKLRRRGWQGRELPLEREAWRTFTAASPSPERTAEGRDLMAVIGRAIQTDLTDHQRGVLLALAVQDVPIDVLAERLETTRGALYKTLHDARKKLRAHLEKEGWQ